MTTTNNFHRFPADKREHLNNLLAWAAEDAERGEIRSAERYTREWLRVYQHCEDCLSGGVSAGDY